MEDLESSAIRPNSKPNCLGDLRAEADHAMLDSAYYETPDYKTLLENKTYVVIVGRRGVGKSAMCYNLSRKWARTPHLKILFLAPEQHEIIGIRPRIKPLGEKFNLIHAGSRILWKYAFLMEVTLKLLTNYKFKDFSEETLLRMHAGKWQQKGKNVFERLKNSIDPLFKTGIDPEIIIGDLSGNLNLNQIEDAILEGLEKVKDEVIILIDKLDEGYEPDQTGIGMLIGLVHAAIDINTKYQKVRTVLFLRDNIYRGIAKKDPDYSRNVEGQVLRLHWEEFSLFNMICNRIRLAWISTAETNIKVWNSAAAYDLQGMDGFRKCLKHTLYRPRDLLTLLNQAFHYANTQNKIQIVNSDIEFVAKEISKGRLDDLVKEYDFVFPGLDKLIALFTGRPAEISYSETENIVSMSLYSEAASHEAQQLLAILDNPKNIISSLYGVGFLGIQDANTKTFIFSHDGKSSAIAPSGNTKLLVHPCYWMALDITQASLDIEEATEINDEYDITVSSHTPEIRNARLGGLIAKLGSIKLGEDGATEFEEWCAECIKIIFAGSLKNMELKPNGQAVQRRDIVATNIEQTISWRRIYNDYKTRQVIFEIKNFSSLLGPDEYRQMNSYLCNSYGTIGFIINRSERIDLEKGKELDWMREIFNSQKKLIVKLNAKMLVNILSKLRSPAKKDVAEEILSTLLDRYERNYLSLKSSGKRGKY